MFKEDQHKNMRKGVKNNAKALTRGKIEEAKKKCLQIVESFLDPSVSEDLLISSSKSISQDDYFDVIEERNILQLCGYPLCAQTVKPIKQKYHISLKSNKIYDVTERKCFCSNTCYKASNFLKAQLSSCPVWLREKDAVVKPVTLLSTTTNSGGAGEEIDLGYTRMTANDIEWNPDKEPPGNIYLAPDDLGVFTTQFDKLKLSEEHLYSQNRESSERTVLSSGEKDQDGGDDMCDPKSNGGSISLITEVCMDSSDSTEKPIKHYLHLDSDDDDFVDRSVEHKKYESLISDKYMPVISKSKVRRALLIEPIGNPDGGPKSPVAVEKIKNSLEHIQNALMTWISVDTFRLILGEDKFEFLRREILEKVQVPVPELETNTADKLEAMKQTYTKICFKLEREEAVELDSNVVSNVKDNLHHEGEMEQSCDCEEDLEKLKVSMFYKGEIGLPEALASKKKAGKKSKPTPRKYTKKEPSGKCPVKMKETEPVTPSAARDASILPVVDSWSQNIIRRQIVTDHLKIVYLNMLPLVGLYYRDISEDLKLLVSTFSLSSTNISFKPLEWKMIAVILFRLLEKKLTTERVWNQEKCWELLEAKLVSFDISLEQIDAMLASLTEYSRLKELLLG